MDSILTLNTFKASMTPKRIEEMTLRIFEGAATSDQIDLIEQYRQEDFLEEQELKKPQEEDLIRYHQTPSPPMSPTQLNSSSALFYHPSSPASVGEQLTDVQAVNNPPSDVLQKDQVVTFHR